MANQVKNKELQSTGRTFTPRPLLSLFKMQLLCMYSSSHCVRYQEGSHPSESQLLCASACTQCLLFFEYMRGAKTMKNYTPRMLFCICKGRGHAVVEQHSRRLADMKKYA
eukprot:1286899-Amphidinium_carterae.1